MSYSHSLQSESHAEEDMEFEPTATYDEDFWNELLENPPTPIPAALPQPSLQIFPPQLQNVAQQVGHSVTVNPYGSLEYTTSEEDLLLEIWPQSRPRSMKTKKFNSMSGAIRTQDALSAKFRDLRGKGRVASASKEEAPSRNYTTEEKETLRECWSAVFLSKKEKAERYNRLQRPRTEEALANRYQRMVTDGEAPPIPDSKDITHKLLTIWCDSKRSLDDRTKDINKKLKANHSTGYLAASYSALIKRNPKHILWHPSGTEDGADRDGPWEFREVDRLIEIWPPSDDPMTFHDKAMNMMSLSGNDRSLQSR